MNVVIIGLGRMGIVQARISRALGENLLAGFDIDQNACSFFKQEFATFSSVSIDDNQNLIKNADVIWLTVTDQAIDVAASRISQYLSKGAIVIHTSGALSSNVLSHIPAHYGSVHPLLACPPKLCSDEQCLEEYSDVIHVVEGDSSFLTYIEQRLQKLNARLTSIDSKKKALYHAAAVFASNYPVTLINTAQNLFKSCGFDNETARDASCRLLESSLKTMKSIDPVSALTGPIKRRDEATLQMHRQALTEFSDEDTLEFYNLLTKFTKAMLGQ